MSEELKAQDCELEYWNQQAEDYALVQIPCEDLRAIINRAWEAPAFNSALTAAEAERNSLPTLLEALKRQREALEWYETHVRDCRKITKDGDAARHALDKDGGERARAALKETTDV